MSNKETEHIDLQENTSTEMQIDPNVDGFFEKNDEKHSELPQTHHHHHHHHSHSSHGHRRSSKNRRRKKNEKRKEDFERFIRHNKKYLIYTAIAIVVLAALTFVGVMLDRQDMPTDEVSADPQNPNVSTTVDKLQISVPFFSEDVVIAGPAVEAYIKAEANVHVRDIYDDYASSGARLDIGLPVELSYEISGIPDGYTVSNAEFIIADNDRFDDPYVISKSGYETKVDVYNLKTGTQYYYRIELAFSNGTESSVGGTFKTAAGPRIMSVEGVYNMRDIGGWTTAEGKEIKQGLLYRGCELDGAVESKYTITQNGVNTMLTLLGIKTDMDLRLPSENKYGTDALGAGVKHNYYSAPMYSAIFNSGENTEKMRKIFSDLADESNYPIYLHCTYGQDRTGTVCYLLEALLGLDEQSLMKDYQLSGLHHGDVASDPMNEFVGRLKALEGNTLSEKVEGYLISIGVTEDEIASIRSIFLND